VRAIAIGAEDVKVPLPEKKQEEAREKQRYMMFGCSRGEGMLEVVQR